jgi:hypothetical protein
MAKGGARIGAGRKSKQAEDDIRFRLSLYSEKAIQTVIDICQNGTKDADRLQAAKLILAYLYGQPQQKIDTNITGINPTITVMNQKDADALKSLFDGTDLQ